MKRWKCLHCGHEHAATWPGRKCLMCRELLTDRTTDPLQTEPLRQGSQSQGLTGAPREGAEGDSKPSR